MVAGGFQVVVRGVSRVPMEIEFRNLPLGIVPQDYAGVEVRGRASKVSTEVETPWSIEHDSARMPKGNVGFELIGLTRRQFFPPKED